MKANNIFTSVLISDIYPNLQYKQLLFLLKYLNLVINYDSYILFVKHVVNICRLFLQINCCVVMINYNCLGRNDKLIVDIQLTENKK